MIENNDRAFLGMLHLMKRVYYPGSGKDLDTLEFILSDLKHVENIVYCDYIEHLSVEDLANLIGRSSKKSS